MNEAYEVRDWSEEERHLLEPFVTDLSGPAYVLHELPPEVAGALARSGAQSPSPGGLPGLLDAVLEQCDLTAGWSWERETMNDLLRQLERLQPEPDPAANTRIWRQLGAEDMAALLARRS